MGIVDYLSTNFGSGTFNHERITQLVGVACEDKVPPTELPGSTWAGIGPVCFNVSPDGTQITPDGSNCEGGASLLINRAGILILGSPGKGLFCDVLLSTQDTIDIVDGAFSWVGLDDKLGTPTAVSVVFTDEATGELEALGKSAQEQEVGFCVAPFEALPTE